MVLSKLPEVKRSGGGWQARCPAHDDCNPSLSIAEADDGRVLLKCHVGCTVAAICEAMGLELTDLFGLLRLRLRNPVTSRKTEVS